MKIKFNRAFLVGLIAILVGIIGGAFLMLLSKNNPIMGYFYLFKGGLGSVERICNTLASATVLTLTGLAVTFAFRTGLFNIGVSGQMLMGGFFATMFGLTVDLPQIVMIPLMILVGMIGGGIWAGIAGFLKSKFNVHEVVSTIMLNWVAYWVVYYIIPQYFKGEYNEIFSKKLPLNATMRFQWLTDITGGSYLNFGLVVAIIAVAVVAFILNRTTLGYELKAVGFNKFGAENAGIPIQKNMIVAMAISGALAGIAGTAYYSGFTLNMQIGVLPTHGFDGIAVSLLGATTPIGVFLSSIFFGILQTGKGYMNAMTSVPPDIADIIIAAIIYFAATSVLIENFIDRISKRKSSRAGGKK